MRQKQPEGSSKPGLAAMMLTAVLAAALGGCFSTPLWAKNPDPFKPIPDVQELLQALIKSAENGDPMLQLNVATLYMEGTGVPQDKNEGARWFRRGALRGLPYAMLNLGLMYYNHELDNVDGLQAYIWVKLSVIRFVGYRDLPMAEKMLSLVAGDLSPEAIERAQERVRELDAQIPQYKMP